MADRGTAVTVVDKGTGEIITQGEEQIQLTERGIANIQHNIEMAEKLVMNVLEENVDWGQQPGTSSMALRDPGASKVCNAFNTYPEHIILHSTENDEMISYLIQTKLISRATGQVVASGIGACSTLETKYGYRWVAQPESFGYQPEDIAGLRTRERDGKIQYRIVNPDAQDLGNTVAKLAAKRSEVDACQSLPGVGSALRKLFDPKLRGGLKDTTPIDNEPDFKRFWSIVKGMGKGINESQVHKILVVESMKDWISAGHSLDEAIMAIIQFLTELAKKTATGSVEAPPPTAVKKEPAATAPKGNEKRQDRQGGVSGVKDVLPSQLTAKDIPNLDVLERYVKSFWGIEPAVLYKELGYTDRKNFEEARIQTSWDAFLTIKATRTPPKQEQTAPEDLPF
jgi:hypothetical protein